MAVIKDIEMKCVSISLDEYTRDKKKLEQQNVRLAAVNSGQKMSELLAQDLYYDRMSINLNFNPGDPGHNSFKVGKTYRIKITAS